MDRSLTFLEEEALLSLRSLTAMGIILVTIVVAALTETYMFLPLAISGAILIVVVFQQPIVWAVSFVLLHLLVLIPTEGISPWEVIFALVSYGYFALWVVRKWMREERILTFPGDGVLIAFLVLCLLSVGPAVAGNIKPLTWFRGLTAFFPYVLFFPLREAFGRNHGRLLLVLSFLALSGWFAITNLLQYRSSISGAVYAWELLSGRQAAQAPFFMAAVLYAVAGYLETDSTWRKMAFLAIVIVFGISLVLTFARGYWIATLVGLGIMLVFQTRTERVHLLRAITVVTASAVLLTFIFLPRVATSMLTTVVERMGSRSLSVTQDPSLNTRLVETEAAWSQILRNPVSGFGPGATYRYRSPLQDEIKITDYVHNGYLSIWFKLGIVGLALILTSFCWKLARGILALRKVGYGNDRAFLLGAIAVLGSMLVVNITSPQFAARDSILIMLLSWSLIDPISRRTMQNEVA